MVRDVALRRLAVAQGEEGEATKALALPAEDELTKSFINLKRAEYIAYGKTKAHKRMVTILDALDEGKEVISLIGTIQDNVGVADSTREALTAGICRADATSVRAVRHPSGDFGIRPNKGPHFLFKQVLTKLDRVTSSKGKIAPPLIPPGQDFDRSSHYLIWSADWTVLRQPPGMVYVVTPLTDDLYIIQSKYEVSALEAMAS